MVSKLISIDDTKKLLNESNWGLEPFDFASAFTMIKDWGEDGIGVVHPEGIITGEIQFPNRVTIVQGDLIVDGSITDGGWDTQITIILGNCACVNLETHHEIFVLGNLTVENVIYGSSSSDFMLRVLGNLTANSIIEAGQHITCGKRCVANFGVSFEAGISAGDLKIKSFFDSGPALAAAAVAEVLTADGDIDKIALKSRAYSKLPLVRMN